MTVDKGVKTSTFFAELDVILDTRMGTLLNIDPDGAERLIKTGYFTRDRDLFYGIDPMVFQEAYKNRDKKTLQGSVMTPMLNFIRDFCRHTYEGNIKTPFIKEPKIVINTHPYQLLSEDLSLLQKAIFYKTGQITPIEMVDMSYEEITPTYLKQETSVISIYDPFEWLEIHSKSERFKRESCPEVMMIGPLVIRNLEIKDIDIKEFQSHMELLSKPFIDLNLMNARVFSADLFTHHEPKTEGQTDPVNT